MPKLPTYNDIYLDLFAKYDVGLAEILGPTGNGKTSALYKDFNNEGRFILKEIETAKRQAIFMTDRKNIVKEVEQACEQAGIKHVYHRANYEIITKIVHEKRFNPLLTEIGELDLFGAMRFHTEHSLRDLFSEIQRLLKMPWNYKDVNENCSEILRACREAISKRVKGLPKESPPRKAILNSPAVQELFPFLAFTQDTSNVLLIGTTQRLGYPMFNGESHKSVYELSGYYMFIDEFDRQVDAFLDHLVEDKKNLRPEIFVSHFCEYYHGKTGESDTTQKGLVIATNFGQAMSEMGLQFPRGKTDNYKFSNADKLFKRTEGEEEPFGYIFDSGYTVSSDMYYLRDNFRNRYEGELVFTKADNCASFLEFYQTIREYEIKIFNFFANLKNGKKIDEESYRTLLKLIYDIKNDEEITEYHKFIDQNSPAFRPRASEFLMEILHEVENHYFRKNYETPELLIADLDLPASLNQIPLSEAQPLCADWQDSLVIYQGEASATLTLPNLASLPPQWTIYLLAWRNSVVLSSPKNCRITTYARPIDAYTLPRGDVVKIRKHLQRPNTFQVIKVFPLLKRLRCDDSFFTRGYAYNQIIDQHSADSENRIEVNHYSLKMTPEARLFMLAARNLVFGISATSDISQQYAHFSLPWVRTALSVFRQSQSEEKRQRICIPDAGSRYQYDSMIAKMLEIKEKTRQTQLYGHVRNACGLNEKDEWSERILNGLQELRGNGVDLYGGKTVHEGKKDRRLTRVSYHFEAFRWIVEDSCNETHLIFTDTFSNTLKIFQYLTASQDSDEPAPSGFAAFRTCLRQGRTEAMEVEPVKQSNDDPEAPKEESTIDTVFLFTINRPSQPQKNAYIIFANADTWGNINDDNKKFYNSIFQRGLEEQRKVIVITQHASASNGVNLQYELKVRREDGTIETVERDFESFYMSHPLYYFFASNYDDDRDIQGKRRETPQDIRNKEKSLYKASKLKINQVIGTQDLKQFIGGGPELDFEHLNRVYKKTEDYRKYMIMLLTQEIGRVERTRDRSKPAEVILPEEMRRIIERTDLSDTNGGAVLSETLFEKRQSRLSSLLKAIIHDIRNTAREKHYRNEAEYESLGKMTTQYKAWMKTLLEVAFDKLRKGQLAEEAAWSLRRLWEGIREAALKGDFHWCWSDHEHFKFEFNLKELCVFTTAHISPNQRGEAQIFIRRGFSEEHILPEWQAGVDSYQPNKVYEVVRDNVIVRNYFAAKGFKERFDFSYQEDNLVFIPEFQKAVLQGAMGEEALKALLKQAGLEIEANDNIPHELFELVDFKIKGLPIYVDAKHWEDSVVENFENAEGEAVSRKLTHEHYAEQKGPGTLSAIQRVTGAKNAKVVYINLLFSEGKSYTKRTYYRNEDCSKIVNAWEQASFVYLAGALSRQNKNKHHEIFDTFLNDVWQELAKLTENETRRGDEYAQ
ncbi:MAG: hypothetical protein BWK78_01565 [Thiotrichaceae bacterium IS1]|nr:MAG: hypothetical protein BWK78_01565 [Thiotrichaceae bacterium IS1]